MAKAPTKLKPRPKPVGRLPQSQRRRSAALHAAAALALVAGIVAAVILARRHLDQRLSVPGSPPQVVLKDQPAWMTEFLAGQITRSARPTEARSAFDRRQLKSVYDALESNPWVKNVRHVRRVYGHGPGDTIEIDCDYRAPVALVHWGEYYWLVDGEAVKLPEQFAAEHLSQLLRGPGRQMNIRIIEGVTQPPPESGNAWIGEDLAAGLEMVKLLYGQPYADEIIGVDVSNAGGRSDPLAAQLVLVTRYGTEIRWGQPPSSREAFPELAVSQKLEHLRSVYDEKGRVDGGQRWLDIRFDAITYPAEEAQAASVQ